jgi:hypothetical protein
MAARLVQRNALEPLAPPHAPSPAASHERAVDVAAAAGSCRAFYVTRSIAGWSASASMDGVCHAVRGEIGFAPYGGIRITRTAVLDRDCADQGSARQQRGAPSRPTLAARQSGALMQTQAMSGLFGSRLLDFHLAVAHGVAHRLNEKGCNRPQTSRCHTSSIPLRIDRSGTPDTGTTTMHLLPS